MKRLPRISRTGDFSTAWNQQIAPVLDENFREARIQPGIGCDVSSSPGGQSIVVARGLNIGKDYNPWDISGAETVTIWPGTIQGLMPSNMFDEFTVDPNVVTYAVAWVTCDGVSITGIELTVQTTIPDGQTPAENGYPSDFGIILGVMKKGVAYNVWERSFGLQPVVAVGAAGSFKGVWKVG